MMRAMLSLPALGLVTLATAFTPVADDGYGACMALARTAPDKALDRAETLWTQGAANPARHCLAVALIAKGRLREAGKVLFDLAGQSAKAGPTEQAELFAQAGRAWIGAGRSEQAEAALSRALLLAPGNGGYHIDRAVARGNAGRNFAALEDLNDALQIAPGNIEALVLRAAAWRRVGARDLAEQDVAEALRLDPRRAGAWIEWAKLAEAAGDTAGATAAYRQALKIYPSGPAGTSARAALARLAGARPR
jgi:tetratricopeptide (TPR) repeat protein